MGGLLTLFLPSFDMIRQHRVALLAFPIVLVTTKASKGLLLAWPVGILGACWRRVSSMLRTLYPYSELTEVGHARKRFRSDSKKHPIRTSPVRYHSYRYCALVCTSNKQISRNASNVGTGASDWELGHTENTRLTRALLRQFPPAATAPKFMMEDQGDDEIGLHVLSEDEVRSGSDVVFPGRGSRCRARHLSTNETRLSTDCT
jgi:hypothetical protein